MKYWLNLFTWKTWQEFLDAGANVSGFRETRWKTVQKIRKGDVLLCYMTGISRFFAIFTVVGEPYKDESQIWEDAVFPCRLPVNVELSLSPEYAVPVVSLTELSYFKDMSSPHTWTAYVRGSPLEIDADDGRIIVESLREAESNPVFHDFDQRKLERRTPVFETRSGTVSIPNNEPDVEISVVSVVPDASVEESATTHQEIQWLLLNIGEQMKLDLWVALNDKGRSFEGNDFKAFSRLRSTLPVQFDEATNRTIELIDVLWLQGNSIIAAFEIEHTTAVYLGLLRMADLITMQPNINIPLFIVAPDERREKVRGEINRPIFSKALKRPLPEICRFIPYSSLKAKIDQAQAGGFLPYLRPDFLDGIAESIELEDF
jgi:hypothetical protein